MKKSSGPVNKKYDGKSQRAADATLKLLRKLPPERIAGQTILDIGCNVGIVAQWLLKEGKAKRVIGFEPLPFACKEARIICQESGFELIEKAVMAKSGSLKLKISKQDLDAGYFCNAAVTPIASGGEKYITVDAVSASFESLLNEYQPSGLKIDAEGSEYDMLLNTDDLSGLDKVNWICLEVHKLTRAGGMLLPFIIERLNQHGLFVTTKFKDFRLLDGRPKSFFGSEVINLERDGIQPEDFNILMAGLKLNAEAVIRSGKKCNDVNYTKMLNKVYGKPNDSASI